MFLDDPGLEPFEPILNGLLNTAFTTGGDVLRERGLSPKAVAHPSLRRRFMRACHYGYDLAQREVCRRVIELERKCQRKHTVDRFVDRCAASIG